MPFSSINNFTCIGGSRKIRQVGGLGVGGGSLANVSLATSVFHRRPCEGVLLLLQGWGSVPLFLLVKKHIATCDFL